MCKLFWFVSSAKYLGRIFRILQPLTFSIQKLAHTRATEKGNERMQHVHFAKTKLCVGVATGFHHVIKAPGSAAIIPGIV